MSSRRTASSPLGRIGVFALMAVIASGTILPLLFMLLTTFKTKAQYQQNMFSMPTSFNLDNYARLLEQFDFPRLSMNSAIVAVGSVAGALFLCSTLGYSMSRMRWWGKRGVMLALFAGMFMPGQVLLLPAYQIIIKLGLVDSYLGLIIFYTATALPFNTLMIISAMNGIPAEVFDAAKIDGASNITMFTRIVIPLIRPTLATAGLLAFIGFWNELLYALIMLQDPSKKTITVSVVSLLERFGSNPPMLYAGLVLSALPVILVFFVAQGQLVKGVGAGAVK